MDGFKILPGKINGISNTLAGMAGEMRTARDSVESVRLGLRGKIIREEEIGARLRQISDRLEELGNGLEQYGNKGVDISKLYQRTEGNLVGVSKEVGSFISGITGGAAAGIAGIVNGMTASGEDEAPTNEGSKHKNSVSWKEGSLSIDGKWGNFETHDELKGELGGASYETGLESHKLEWEEDGELKNAVLLSGMLAGEAHLASGSVSSSAGFLNGSMSATVGKVAAKGEVKASLVEDGKLVPQIGASAEASAVGAEGELETSLGTENNNLHAGADGKLGYAEAHAKAGIGKVTYENRAGEEIEGYGVCAEVGAEAYVAQGSVKGGIDISGIKIDVGITGKFGGAGITAGGGISTGGVGGSVGLGAGVGVGIDFNIDWSGFKLSW